MIAREQLIYSWEVDWQMEASVDCASRRGKYHFLLCARQRTLPASQALLSLFELFAFAFHVNDLIAQSLSKNDWGFDAMRYALCPLRYFVTTNFFMRDTKYDDDSHYDSGNVWLQDPAPYFVGEGRQLHCEFRGYIQVRLRYDPQVYLPPRYLYLRRVFLTPLADVCWSNVFS